MDANSKVAVCVSDEMLAALVDGRLVGKELEEIQAHVAGCDRCFGLLADTAAIQRQSEAIPTQATPKSPRRPRVPGMTIVLLSLAASLFVLVWVRPFGLTFTSDQRADAALQTISRNLALRPSIGRFAAPFEYAPPPDAQRAPSDRKELAIPIAEAIVQIRQSAATHRSAEALKSLGIAYVVSGNLDDAVNILTEATHLNPSDSGSHTDLSAAYLARWNVARQPADATKALDESEKALAVSPRDPSALFNKSWALEALGMRDAAIKAWTGVGELEPGSDAAREALEHITRLRSTEAAALPRLGLLTRDQVVALSMTNASALYGEFDRELLEWADRTLAGGSESIPSALDQVAQVLAAQGRDGSRGAFLKAAARLPRSSSDARLHVAAAIRRFEDSRDAYGKSDYTRAVELARQAANYAKEVGASNIDFETQAIWASFATSGGRDQAAADAKRLEGVAEQCKCWFSVARLRYVQALRLGGIARVSEALAEYDAALDAAQKAGASDLTATFDSAVGELNREIGDTTAAWRYHAEALNLLPVLSFRLRHLVLSSAGSTALQEGNASAARLLAQVQIENSEEWKDALGVVGSHIALARALVSADRPKEATQALATARASLDRFDVPSSARDRYLAELDMIGGQNLLGTDPRASATALQRARAAFAAAGLGIRIPEVELVLSQAHGNLGDMAAAKQDLLRGMDEFEAQRAGLGTDQLRVSRMSHLWEIYSRFIDLSSDEPNQALMVAERSRGRSLLDSIGQRREVRLPSIEAVSSLVPEHAVAIVYAVLPGKLLTWQITAHGVRPRSTPVSQERLRDLVQQFSEDVKAGSPSPSGTELSALLLPTDLRTSRVDEIVLLPDGPLCNLPFGLLPLGKNRKLGQVLPFAISPSLAILASLPTPAIRAPSGRVLLIGVADSYGPQNRGLPNVDQEISALARLYPRATVVVGRAATPATVLAAMPLASVIHFAGHATVDEVVPGDSKLFVAPGPEGSVIRPGDVAALHLRQDTVVVLASCETARGAVFRGEGPMNWARAFLAAGARAVIASPLKVGDIGMSRLSLRLHQALNEGNSPADAVAAVYRSVTDQRGPEAIEVIGGWRNYSGRN